MSCVIARFITPYHTLLHATPRDDALACFVTWRSRLALWRHYKPLYRTLAGLDYHREKNLHLCNYSLNTRCEFPWGKGPFPLLSSMHTLYTKWESFINKKKKDRIGTRGPLNNFACSKSMRYGDLAHELWLNFGCVKGELPHRLDELRGYVKVWVNTITWC